MIPSPAPKRRFRLPLPPGARRVPVLLLGLSLLVTVAAIVQAQQAVRSHRATADRLLGKYGSWAAWSYRQHTAQLMGNAINAALAPVVDPAERHRAPVPVSALLAYEKQQAPGTSCNPIYGAPFYFRLPLEGGPAEVAGTEPDAAMRSWLTSAVRADAPAAQKARASFRLLSAVVGGKPRHLVYTIVHQPGASPLAYGYELEPARYRPLFQHVIDEETLIPATTLEGRTSAEVLTVRVVAPGVGELFASDSSPEPRLAGADPMGAWFGGLTVRAAVRPEAAGLLIIGGLPRSRLPLLLGMLLVSVGMAAVAVGQLRREAELARMRSDFVSSVSHELRTPLAQVRLFVETLRLGRWKTEQQRAWLLDNVDRETTRLTNLVDNVLHFSRSERGGQGGELQPVELPGYLQSIADSFAPLAASRRMRVETEWTPGLVVHLHPDAFRQVILNLLDNAAKYGPLGQTVRLSAHLSGDETVRIAVEDEGPGIDAAERELVWEPFRRGRRTVGSAAAGSGIGLSVVREIVGWHGGTARVEDGVRGARFVVELPGHVAPVHIDADAPAAVEAAA